MSEQTEQLSIIEPVTNIQFPYIMRAENDMVCIGCGVRTKFYINVYAVGTYVNRVDLARLKENSFTASSDVMVREESIQKLLCNPTALPRIIRIVLHWNNIPTHLITKGITDAIRPRLEDKVGIDDIAELENKLHSLMESDGNDEEGVRVGTEIFLSLNSDTMYFSNKRQESDDNIIFTEEKKIQHREFCLALCDVYYGSDPVSVDHKENVVGGIVNIIQ